MRTHFLERHERNVARAERRREIIRIRSDHGYEAVQLWKAFLQGDPSDRDYVEGKAREMLALVEKKERELNNE